MKSLKEYTNAAKQNDYLKFVTESVDNNVRIINEAQLIASHGKDLDNLLYKTKQYFYNHVNGVVNEAENNYKFTLNEQETIRDLMIFCLEDYKEKLLNECTVYEGLLNDTMSINEAEFQLGSVVGNLWKQGKDKVKKIYNDAKTKIAAVNDMIKAFAEHSIKSLKEFANKIVEMLDNAVGNSLLYIAKKIGFGEEKVVEISDELMDDIKANPDKITKNDIFESLGKEIIDEGIVDWVQNSKAGKWYAEKKQKPLWNAFFQFCNWLLVCKLLPAAVLAIFPGGLLYYIVSIAVKVVWNLKKLGKIIDQTKDYIHSWNTMTTWEKIWKGIVLLLTWGMWFHNVMSIAGNAGKVFDSLKDALKSGNFWKMMFGKAHTGIEPDKLEAMGAAVIRWMGKGFQGSIDDAYNEIMDACKEITGAEAFDAAKKAVEASKKAADLAKETNAQTQEKIEQAKEIAQSGKTTGSQDLLDKVDKLGISKDSVEPEKTYAILLNGHHDARWWKEMMDLAKENDIKLNSPEDLLHKGLNATNPAAGSTVMTQLPGKLIKLASAKGILGYQNKFTVFGELAKEISDVDVDLPSVVASFSAAMASDVPIITFKQKGNGFRVRLGDEKSKNYIYEVGKDDVKFVKPTEINNDKVKKAYDKIKEVINEENKKFIEKIKSSDLKEDEKKKIIKQIEIFANGGKDDNGNEHKPYAEELAKTPLVVISGTRLTEEEQNKYDGKESLKSLTDYLMINESVNKETISGFIDTITTINTLICKVYNVTNITDIKPDDLDGKLKEFYDKNISNWIDNIKKLNDELVKQNVKWCLVDGKLSLDADLTDDKYKSIQRLLTFIAHPDKAQNLKDTCDTLLNTAQKIDTSDTDIFTKLFNGDELSEEENSKIVEFIKKKFDKLSDDDIKEIISKISDLANKTKDDTVKESLITESASAEDILNNLKQLRDYLINRATKVNTNIKNDKNTNKNSFSGTVSSLLQSIFSTKENRQTWDQKNDEIKSDKILSGSEVDLVAGFFANYVFNDMDDSLDNMKKAFTAIIELKENLLKTNEVKNKTKSLYAYIIDLLKESERFENDIEKGRFKVYDFEISDEVKTEFDSKLNNKISSTTQKELNKELEDKVNNSSKNDKSNDESEESDDLLQIYKTMIMLFAKDSKFKDDVKAKEYELLDGVSIDESYKSLYHRILTEALEKKDYQTNLVKLKDYLLKASKKDKGGALQKSDDKHEVMTLQPKDIVKSMGVTYEPEEKKSDDGNVTSGELPAGKEIKQLPYIPKSSDNGDNTDNTNDGGGSGGSDDKKNEDETGHQPVLIFSNVYGMDIANANENGPRKEIYSLKGAFHSLQFFEIKHGMNKHDIQEMLGEWMYTMVNNLCNITAISPFEKKKNWWKDKFIANKNLKENEERREFGNLTNGEIADIMNKKENAKNYVLTKTNSIIIAQDEDDKKYAEDKKKKYVDKLTNADEETVKAVKKIDPDAVDDKGKIKKEKVDKLADKLSSYKLAQYKASQTKKSSGFFSKIKNFVKGLFGGSKEEGEKYNSLLSHIDESVNESLMCYDEFLNEMFAPKSLAEYIAERNIHK